MVTPAIQPTSDKDTTIKVIRKIENIKVYGFLLSSDKDHPLSKMVHEKWYDIHHATGDNFLLLLFESPSEWSKHLKKYWRTRLVGVVDDFDEIWADWQDGSDPGIAFDFIDLFKDPKISLTELPCLVLFTNLDESKGIMRKIPNKDPEQLYKFMLGLIQEVRNCCESNSAVARLDCLQNSLTSPRAKAKFLCLSLMDYLRENPAKIITMAVNFGVALASSSVIPLTPEAVKVAKAVRDSIK